MASRGRRGLAGNGRNPPFLPPSGTPPDRRDPRSPRSPRTCVIPYRQQAVLLAERADNAEEQHNFGQAHALYCEALQTLFSAVEDVRKLPATAAGDEVLRVLHEEIKLVLERTEDLDAFQHTEDGRPTPPRESHEDVAALRAFLGPWFQWSEFAIIRPLDADDEVGDNGDDGENGPSAPEPPASLNEAEMETILLDLPSVPSDVPYDEEGGSVADTESSHALFALHVGDDHDVNGTEVLLVRIDPEEIIGTHCHPLSLHHNFLWSHCGAVKRDDDETLWVVYEVEHNLAQFKRRSRSSSVGSASELAIKQTLSQLLDFLCFLEKAFERMESCTAKKCVETLADQIAPSLLVDLHGAPRLYIRPLHSTIVNAALGLRRKVHSEVVPPPEEGEQATPTMAGLMWRLGSMLYTQHFHRPALLTGESVRMPLEADAPLRSLLVGLLQRDASRRLGPCDARWHEYFVRGRQKAEEDREMIPRENILSVLHETLRHLQTENRVSIGSHYIAVRRQFVVEDVLHAFDSRHMTVENLRKRLSVRFEGEEGIGDGPKREMFSLVFRELFKPQRRLFVTGSEDGYYVLPAASSDDDDTESQHIYEAIGRILVKALLEDVPWPPVLSPSFFKFLLETECELRDLAVFDVEYARSLAKCLDGEVDVNLLGLQGEEQAGEEEDAKGVLVMSHVREVLVERRRGPLEALKKGFNTLQMDRGWTALLHITHWADFRRLVCGRADLDASSLVGQLDFARFPSSSTTPADLTAVLRELSPTHLSGFLYFCTGLQALPYGGLPRRIEVRCKQGTTTVLPEAHVCFFRLELPDYQNEDLLRSKLLIALETLDDAGYGMS